MIECGQRVPAMSQREPDSLRRFLFERFPVRGELVHLNATWREICARRDYPAPVRQLLGEACAATALMAATIKFEGQLGLQIQGEGLLSLLLVQCDDQFHMRATAQWDESAIDDASPAENLLPSGRLALTIDAEDTHHRYQGLVELIGADVARALEHYFLQSEQIPTRLCLAADEAGVGGLLVQQLPGSSDDPDAWRRCLALTDTLTSRELLDLSGPQLLHRLYHEEDVRVFEQRLVSFRCRCSRERIAGILRAMGKQEVGGIVEDEGEVAVTCEFCGRRYIFDAVDAGQLCETQPQPPVPPTAH